jgi:hypothetical protein
VLTDHEPARPASGDPSHEPMLLDGLLPLFDATRVEHRVIAGEVAAVYEATRRADFMRAWRESAVVRVLFALRGAGERVAALARRRAPVPPPEIESMRLADMPAHRDWVLLGEAPPREIAFGAIGRFWAGETAWEQIDATDFSAFVRPGVGKMGCNFSLRPYGSERTLVSYEARTHGTDETSRRGFLRYWRPLSPFIGVVMRSQLGVVADQAAAARRRSP